MSHLEQTQALESNFERKTYLDETIQLTRMIESSYLDLASRLLNIRDQELWRGHYDSWQEFLEDVRISNSRASRLITLYEKLVLDYGIKKEDLTPIGWSSAYQIAKHTENKLEAQELITFARHTRRKDLEDELRERKTGCQDHEIGEKIILGKCKNCGKLVRLDEN